MPMPTRCVACGGDDLYHQPPHIAGCSLRFGSFLHNAMIAGTVCLACGHVALWVPDYELRKVRQWKASDPLQRRPSE